MPKILKNKNYGKSFYHIGPIRDEDLIKGFENNKTSIEKCDFILCTGFFDKEESSLNYYKKLLKGYTKIKMLLVLLVVGQSNHVLDLQCKLQKHCVMLIQMILV